MHQLPLEQQVLDVAQIAALLGLCAKLCWNGLSRVYIFFFIYLVLDLLQALIPVFVPLTGRLYVNLYVGTQPLILCSYLLVVLELYSATLHNLKGLDRIARRYIRITLAVAIVVSLLPLFLEKPPNKLTAYLFIFERPILSSLLIFVLLITGFLVYYPVPIGRNVRVYLIGYAAYFVVTATSIFLSNLGYYWNRSLSDLQMSVSLICLMFWLFCLTRAGEEKIVVVGHTKLFGDEQRLLAQLEAINASLLRSARK